MGRCRPTQRAHGAKRSPLRFVDRTERKRGRPPFLKVDTSETAALSRDDPASVRFAWSRFRDEEGGKDGFAHSSLPLGNDSDPIHEVNHGSAFHSDTGSLPSSFYHYQYDFHRLYSQEVFLLEIKITTKYKFYTVGVGYWQRKRKAFKIVSPWNLYWVAERLILLQWKLSHIPPVILDLIALMT